MNVKFFIIFLFLYLPFIVIVVVVVICFFMYTNVNSLFKFTAVQTLVPVASPPRFSAMVALYLLINITILSRHLASKFCVRTVIPA